jgi:glucose-6-phosphate isomerase
MAEDPSRPPAAAIYTQSIAGCLADAIGCHGLSAAELSRWLEPLAAVLAELKSGYHHRRLPHLRVAEETEDLAAARAALAVLERGAETIVFFGVGGSSLGGQALAQFGGWNVPGLAGAHHKRQPRTRFYDNLDGATLAAVLAADDLRGMRFVVISTSGNTPETLVQALAALTAVRQAGLASRVGEMFLGVTEPMRRDRRNGLRALFAAHGIPVLDHHPGIGGHGAALTTIGLLPAMARGLDASAVRAGARDVVTALQAAGSPAEFAPALGAAVAIGLARDRGVRAHVLMPYSDRLGRFAHWFAHLWAESLGKGGQGSLPLPCLGPVDQHGRLQLFLDGPREYLVSIVRTPTAGQGPHLAAELCTCAGVAYLAGRTAGDLVAAQAMAVPEALVRAGRPVRTIDLPTLDERSIGALMMHFMLETILAARLVGVDAFDPPAVELAQEITRRRVAALPRP